MCICVDITSWFVGVPDEARQSFIDQLRTLPVRNVNGDEIGKVQDVVEKNGHIKLEACLEGGVESLKGQLGEFALDLSSFSFVLDTSGVSEGQTPNGWLI